MPILKLTQHILTFIFTCKLHDVNRSIAFSVLDSSYMSQNYPVPSFYSCICRKGWQGVACTKDIDECSTGTHNCSHVCKNQRGTFGCSCRYGYHLESDGHSCTRDLSVCLRPCHNGGTCDQGRCICTQGFTGETCETDVNECAEGEFALSISANVIATYARIFIQTLLFQVMNNLENYYRYCGSS